MKFLKLLLLPFLFFACKSKDCETPACPPPNINAMANLYIAFDTLFSSEELSDVILTVKYISTEDVILIDTINNLQLPNFGIDIGGHYGYGYPISSILQEGIFFYEIDLPITNHFYTIDQLIFQDHNYNELCSCPWYFLKSLEVNDSLVVLESESLTLKK